MGVVKEAAEVDEVDEDEEAEEADGVDEYEDVLLEVDVEDDPAAAVPDEYAATPAPGL